MGEALHDVDFQQLKIENAQFLETIEARNKELIQLKLACGNTLQVLNTYKVRLTSGSGTLQASSSHLPHLSEVPVTMSSSPSLVGIFRCSLTSPDLAKPVS